jgi:Fe-Mn family superoxide dismutase
MFSLIQLPYADNALEPIISARTISFHHGKHLQTYVDNLNKLIAGTEYESMSLEDIVVKSAAAGQSATAIFNNAGQILNHNLYFTQFKPVNDTTTSKPKESKLVSQIEKQWGSLEAFLAEFESKGTSLFGSGWVWLAAAPDGSLVITQEPGAGNPVTKGLRPLLTFDVWEHAYYLDYQNRRAAQLHDLWKIFDWHDVDARYNAEL